jgi:hypothetical protein
MPAAGPLHFVVVAEVAHWRVGGRIEAAPRLTAVEALQ